MFPVEPGGKRPLRTRRHPGGVPWSRTASADPVAVANTWLNAPGSNVGIACKPSGLLVVDCDMPKPGASLDGTPFAHLVASYLPPPDGLAVLDEMLWRYNRGEDSEALYGTYTVRTASGGRHLYYRWPQDVHASQASPVPGFVDIRCNGGNAGGYVLAAGSVTPSGRYEVEVPGPIRPAPAWLVALCRERERARPVRAPGPVSEHTFGGLAATVAAAPEGNRNALLYWAARCVRDEGGTRQLCEEVLVPAALSAGLTEREARQTIRSGFNA